jgi:hypothetical protein
MSHSGLHVFLSGSRPHPDTVKKITEWSSVAADGHKDSRDIVAAIALLAGYVREAPTDVASKTRLASVTSEIARLSER